MHKKLKPDKFADFVNGSLYQGREVIKPEQIEKSHACKVYGIRCPGIQKAAKELQAKYRKMEKKSGNGLKGAEYLSGMKKEDRLEPVITIVFYHGTEEYDGCRTLHNMLSLGRENEIFRQYISNYHINLIALKELDEENFQTGVRELVGILKRHKSKEALQKYCKRVLQGRQKGVRQGIRGLIADYLEEGVTETRIIEKLQKIFALDEEAARNYFGMYGR